MQLEQQALSWPLSFTLGVCLLSYVQLDVADVVRKAPAVCVEDVLPLICRAVADHCLVPVGFSFSRFRRRMAWH